ncbi:MAG: tripartite tricarboxylate transporter substrate binding protein, partial [Candidatus Binatia bacterium]
AFGLAQEYPWTPERPVTIIVPWAAGGSTDSMARIAAAELEAALGQPFVVVNQPGASGSKSTRVVAPEPSAKAAQAAAPKATSATPSPD